MTGCRREGQPDTTNGSKLNPIAQNTADAKDASSPFAAQIHKDRIVLSKWNSKAASQFHPGTPGFGTSKPEPMPRIGPHVDICLPLATADVLQNHDPSVQQTGQSEERRRKRPRILYPGPHVAK